MTLNKAINNVWPAESFSNQQSAVRDTSVTIDNSVTIQEEIGVINFFKLFLREYV